MHIILMLVMLAGLIWLIRWLRGGGGSQPVIDGIIETTFSSYRPKALLAMYPEAVAEKLFADTKPYYGYDFHGGKVDRIKSRLLHDGEQMLALFGGICRSPDGYYLFTTADGRPAYALVLLTDQRIIIWPHELPEDQIKTVRYTDVTKLTLHRAMLELQVSLHTNDSVVVIHQFFEGPVTGMFPYAFKRGVERAAAPLQPLS